MSLARTFGVIGISLFTLDNPYLRQLADSAVAEGRRLGYEVRVVGAACYYIPVLTVIVGNWFHKHFATVSGIVLSCSGIAGAILSPVLANLLETQGLRRTTWISAATAVTDRQTTMRARIHISMAGIPPSRIK